MMCDICTEWLDMISRKWVQITVKSMGTVIITVTGSVTFEVSSSVLERLNSNFQQFKNYPRINSNALHHKFCMPSTRTCCSSIYDENGEGIKALSTITVHDLHDDIFSYQRRNQPRLFSSPIKKRAQRKSEQKSLKRQRTLSWEKLQAIAAILRFVIQSLRPAIRKANNPNNFVSTICEIIENK